MVQVRGKLSGFCAGRNAVRVRVRSPCHQIKNAYSPVKTSTTTPSDDYQKDGLSDGNVNGFGVDPSDMESGNRVMVVVDSSLEAKGALQWALTHTVRSHDSIVLLHIIKPFNHDDVSNKENNRGANELLYSMKNICQARRQGVKVEIAVLEGREKGPLIVEEAKRQGVSLLVLGQRKRSILWRVRMLWAGRRVRMSGVVDHCIGNAHCMAVAVRRNSKKYGGYLITTKSHKDFWLLA